MGLIEVELYVALYIGQRHEQDRHCATWKWAGVCTTVRVVNVNVGRFEFEEIGRERNALEDAYQCLIRAVEVTRYLSMVFEDPAGDCFFCIVELPDVYSDVGISRSSRWCDRTSSTPTLGPNPTHKSTIAPTPAPQMPSTFQR